MRLWLLRHAKSSWADPSARDEDRALAPRGERAAARMCDHLGKLAIRPELALCSSALRTRQTLARVLPALGGALEVRIEQTMYTFDADELLERLGEVSPGVSSVLLVGHNPALQDLAVRLADRGDRLDELALKFPTGALAEIEFESGSWHALAERPGELTRFVVPRELEA
jgi:phosphohistidine phosphatase